MAHGIDEIIGLTVNDQFAVEEWQKFYDPERKLTLFADADGDLAKAMGLDIDLSAALGHGLRYARATLEVDDGIVTKVHLENMDGVLKPAVCLAEHVLPQVKNMPKKKSKYAKKKSNSKRK